MHQTKAPNLNLSLFHISRSAPSSMLVVVIFLDKSTKNFQEDICNKSKNIGLEFAMLIEVIYFRFLFLQIFDFELTKEDITVIESFDRIFRGRPWPITRKKTVRLFTFLNQILIN